MQIEELLAIMSRLRDPEHGCPWDRKQTFDSIVPYTIEEAYEVADAIEREDLQELKDELGDLLFQVVFYAQMAEEAGHFDFSGVVRSIVEKMIRRHPHVFDEVRFDSQAELRRAWEEQKSSERAARSAHGLLDGIARALPALVRCEKLQRRAAKVGFDWACAKEVEDKVQEELGELMQEIDAGGEPARVEHEVGDLLFSCVNLARHAGVDAEHALRAANRRFEERFRYIEESLERQGRTLDQADLEEMDRLWQAAKARPE